MPDWNSRLVVQITDPDKNDVLVTPIDSFTPTFQLGAAELHSIEATHIGMVYAPRAITFMMTVKAMGVAAAQLMTIALNGHRFDIALQEQDGGSDWAFKSIVLSNCVITSANPTAPVSGAPTATF